MQNRKSLSMQKLTVALLVAGAVITQSFAADIVLTPPAGGAVTISGSVALPDSSATTGKIMKGTNPFIHNYGFYNSFIGLGAGNFTLTGSFNTVSGYLALANNTTGSFNTAGGAYALSPNTGGSYNTANGYIALFHNLTGSFNTASGSFALGSNKDGSYNTAIGNEALDSNRGSNNIAIGSYAGAYQTTGSSNIYVGNEAVDGESNTIRIGSGVSLPGGPHTRFFVAGVSGVSVSGPQVLISDTGQLGVTVSSHRFKDDIADMNTASNALMKLRPVTFHYKAERNLSERTLQYGLIAEEVAEVYPELVARSRDGQIETVLYQYLPPMLLNEYQKQQRTIEAQANETQKQQRTIEAQANETQKQQRTLEAQAAEMNRQTMRVAELERDRQKHLARIDALEVQAAEIAILKQQMAQFSQIAIRQTPAAQVSLAAGW